MGKYAKPSTALVLELINAANIVEQTALLGPLQQSDIVYGVPQPTPQGVKNTQLVVSAAYTSAYEGAVVVTYNRLDITTFFKNIAVNLDVQGATTTSDLLPKLNQLYGLGLVSDEVIESPVSPLTSTTPSVTHSIQFRPESLVYTGVLSVTVGPDSAVGQVLASVVQTTLLGGLYYPSNNTALGQAYLYSYRLDFTADASTLAGLTQGTPSELQTIARLINNRVPLTDTWIYYGAARDWNLYRSTISYNGPTADPAVQNAANPAYSHVVVVTLNATYCSNFEGELWLHYNQ